MQVIQQFKKHTTSNKNHKSPINRGVKNHTFKFVKHTYESFNKNLHNLKAKFNRFKFTNYIKNAHRLTTLGLTSSCLLVLLILAICIPLYKDELNTKATTGTSTQATTSLALSSGASSTAEVDLLASSTSGSFVSGGSASYNVYTTNYTGYTLVIASSTSTNYNDGKLTMSGDSSNYFSTITDNSGITASTFSNASSGSTYNGKWGFKPSTYYDSSTNSNKDNANSTTGLFFPAPTVSGFTIAKTTTANGSTTSTASSNSNNYTFAIGARADQTQKAGTYTNTYVLQAVGNAITYAITYSDNSGDSTVANLPYFNGNTSNHTQSGSTSTTNIVLKGTGTNSTDDATPTRTGYTFSKWCLGTVSNNGTTCTGTQYSAGDNFGIDQATLNTTTLYAIWTPATYDITLTNTNATTSGSTSAYTTYNSSNIYAGSASSAGTSTITSPQRAYSFSGFTKTNSAYNATVSSTTTKTYTYTFDGWYTASSGGTRVVTSSGALVASVSGYTNSSSQWIATSGVTLYAHWTAGTNQTLPTITQTDSTNGNGNCYWSSTNSTTGGQTYTSGATISGTSVSSGATLYGVCKFPVKITFAGTGVSSVAVKSGSATGTTVGTVSSSGGSVTDLAYGTTYYLVPTFSSGNELDNWKKTSAKGALAGTTTQNTTTTTANPTLTIGTTSTTGSVGITITGKASCSTVAFSGYMQDMSTTTVANACVGTTGTLTDRRDNKTYNVAKLADNNLWMTENLAIDLTATSYDTLYGTGSNAGKMTNATSQALGYLKGTTTGTSSDQWAMAAVKKTWTSSDSYSQPWIAVDSSTSGACNNASTWCVNSSGAWSSTSVTSATINGTTSKAQGKIGVYYNYCAASAGSYCWGNGTSGGSQSSDPNASSLRDITSDICPYGWRLPTSSSSGEFAALYTAYSSNATNFQTALVTPLSGYFLSGKAYYQGRYGSFWSSTWYDTNYMHDLFVSSSSVFPSDSNDRYIGYSVRCIYDPPTMQTATSTSLAALMPNTGDTAVLVDNRDGQQYRVGKLADGKYWMLDNLRLGDASENITLTSDDTNFSSSVGSWVLPKSSTSCFSSSNCTNGAGNTGTGLTVPAINTSKKTTTGTSYGSGSGMYGVFYNFCAATTGGNCSNSTSSSNASTDRDICPKGWRIPTGGSNGEYMKLYTAYSSNYTNFQNALSTPLSGYFVNNAASSQDSSGYFWSGTRWSSGTTYNGTVRFNLYVTASSVNPSSEYRSAYAGLSVRCILK